MKQIKNVFTLAFAVGAVISLIYAFYYGAAQMYVMAVYFGAFVLISSRQRV